MEVYKLKWNEHFKGNDTDASHGYLFQLASVHASLEKKEW